MATLSASRRNSANSNPNTPRQSLSGVATLASIPRMSSLTEQENMVTALDDCDNHKNFATKETISKEDDCCAPLKVLKEIKNENNKAYRSRACSERSDSGISDCSSHLTSSSCTSTPLLGKKFRINEETESLDKSDSLTLILNSRNKIELTQSCDNDKISEEDNSSDSGKGIDDERDRIKTNGKDKIKVVVDSETKFEMEKAVDKKPPLNLKVADKIGTFNGNKNSKGE